MALPPIFQVRDKSVSLGQNPLELGAAAIFAILFIIISLLSTWVTTHFGVSGIYSLAAIIGFTDIDPFVLNFAQGGTSAVPTEAVAPAILIATSSNNLLKAGYAALFAGGRTTAQSAAALGVLQLPVSLLRSAWVPLLEKENHEISGPASIAVSAIADGATSFSASVDIRQQIGLWQADPV